VAGAAACDGIPADFPEAVGQADVILEKLSNEKLRVPERG
jgi:hypothetical protein